MCALAAGIADAHTLHVGNKSFALSQTKYTTPSLAFGVGNEVWYAPLAPIFINESLHFRYKNIPFSVDVPDDYPDLLAEYNCPQIFTDTENYTYDENGRLIGADENLYLQSTGTQIIDTAYLPKELTRVEAILRIPRDGWASVGQNCDGQLFGAVDQVNSTVLEINFGGCDGNAWQEYTLYPWICVNGTANCPINNLKISLETKASKSEVIVDAKNKIAKYGSFQKNFTQAKRTAGTVSIAIFGYKKLFATGKTEYRYYNRNSRLYIYRAKILEDDVLVHHFVPVPACMRIGNFIVPENGMWDIVNQQFYGNSGTGSFIYGRDE